MNSLTLDVLLVGSIQEAYNVIVEGIEILERGGGESSYKAEQLRQWYFGLFFHMVQVKGLEYNPQIVEISKLYICYHNLLPHTI